MAGKTLTTIIEFKDEETADAAFDELVCELAGDVVYSNRETMTVHLKEPK